MNQDAADERDWRTVESQAELDALDGSVNWDDAEAVAFIGDTLSAHDWFPKDVARSGYLNWNVRVLFFVADKRGSHLELLLVDCDEVDRHLFRGFNLRGRVDTLKRVEVNHYNDGQTRMRCSRLMYRFVEVDQSEARSRYGLGENEDVGVAG